MATEAREWGSASPRAGALVVAGPRQAGKTTFAELLLARLGRGSLRRLDDAGTLAAAREDPATFVRTGERPIVIDEVQLGGDALVRAVKVAVDTNREAGQFILTGSANFLTVPVLSESLAGRAAFLDLWPFAEAELAGADQTFIDSAFDRPDGYRSSVSGMSRDDYLRLACRGGYPEVVDLPETQRARWFSDHVRTTIQRDVVDLGGIRKVASTRRLLTLLAARTAQELVMQRLIDDSDLDRQAVYDHRAWLETVHLVATLPAWSRGLTARAARRPKVYVTDPGLAAWLLGRDAQALAAFDEPATGPLLETLAVCELVRQTSWSDLAVTLHHFRDRDGAEADVIIEAADGRIVGVEVKASASPASRWFTTLRLLRERAGARFVHGFALHTGTAAASFGDRLTAIPLAALWHPPNAPGGVRG